MKYSVTVDDHDPIEIDTAYPSFAAEEAVAQEECENCDYPVAGGRDDAKVTVVDPEGTEFLFEVTGYAQPVYNASLIKQGTKS